MQPVVVGFVVVGFTSMSGLVCLASTGSGGGEYIISRTKL